MRTYIQHVSGNMIHIVRVTTEYGTARTWCGKRYIIGLPHSFTPKIEGEREEDAVCWMCRKLLASSMGKKVYVMPVLRRGRKGKHKILDMAVRQIKERQRLEEWNKRAIAGSRETS